MSLTRWWVYICSDECVVYSISTRYNPNNEYYMWFGVSLLHRVQQALRWVCIRHDVFSCVSRNVKYCSHPRCACVRLLLWLTGCTSHVSWRDGECVTALCMCCVFHTRYNNKHNMYFLYVICCLLSHRVQQARRWVCICQYLFRVYYVTCVIFNKLDMNVCIFCYD
jgi:hypothetical protein